jgi:hypothetical protein
MALDHFMTIPAKIPITIAQPIRQALQTGLKAALLFK